MAVSPFITRALEFCRDFAGDVIDEVRWTDSKLIDLLQEANAEVHGELAASSDPRCPFGWIRVPFEVERGKAEYSYPVNLRRFRRLVRYDPEGWVVGEWLLTDPMNDRPGVVLLSQRRGMLIRPVPNQSASDWYLEYEAGASPFLAHGEIDSGTSTSSSIVAGAVSLGTLIKTDDYYIGQFLTVMRESSSDSKRETRLITDWNGSNSTWTISPEISWTPSEGDSWEVSPCLDPPEDLAIMWRVVMTMKLAAGDSEGFAAAERAYQKCLTRAVRRNFDLNGQMGPAMAFEQADMLGQESYGVNA